MKKLLLCVVGLLLISSAGATHFDRSGIEKSITEHSETTKADISVTAHFHEASGRWMISGDGGKTWMDRVDFEAENPNTPGLTAMMGEISEDQRKWHDVISVSKQALCRGLWLWNRIAG